MRKIENSNNVLLYAEPSQQVDYDFDDPLGDLEKSEDPLENLNHLNSKSSPEKAGRLKLDEGELNEEEMKDVEYFVPELKDPFKKDNFPEETRPPKKEKKEEKDKKDKKDKKGNFPKETRLSEKDKKSESELSYEQQYEQYKQEEEDRYRDYPEFDPPHYYGGYGNYENTLDRVGDLEDDISTVKKSVESFDQDFVDFKREIEEEIESFGKKRKEFKQKIRGEIQEADISLKEEMEVEMKNLKGKLRGEIQEADISLKEEMEVEMKNLKEKLRKEIQETNSIVEESVNMRKKFRKVQRQEKRGIGTIDYFDRVEKRLINLEKLIYFRDETKFNCDKCRKKMNSDKMNFVQCCGKSVVCDKCTTGLTRKILPCEICTGKCKCYEHEECFSVF